MGFDFHVYQFCSLTIEWELLNHRQVILAKQAMMPPIFCNNNNKFIFKLSIAYTVHVKLVPAISEGYSRWVQEKKEKFYNRYMYIYIYRRFRKCCLSQQRRYQKDP